VEYVNVFRMPNVYFQRSVRLITVVVQTGYIGSQMTVKRGGVSEQEGFCTSLVENIYCPILRSLAHSVTWSDTSQQWLTAVQAGLTK
jgi:hypothetical protein